MKLFVVTNVPTGFYSTDIVVRAESIEQIQAMCKEKWPFSTVSSNVPKYTELVPGDTPEILMVLI